MEPFERIHKFIADVRRELNLISAGEALLAGLSLLGAAALVTLSFALVAEEGEGPWGWALVAIGVALAGVTGWRLWVRPRRLRACDAELALWIEARLGGLESGLVTAVQTRELVADEAPDAPLGFSAALAREAAARTSRGIAEIRPRSLGDRGRLKRLAGAAAAILGVGALIALTAPGFYAEGGRRLVTGPVEVTADGERVVSVAVSQLSVEIVPPAYTKLKPRRLQRSTGDLEALQGSEVRFVGATLYPATEAVLILESEPDARWPLELGDDGSLRGAFRVGQPDRYQFALTEPDGTIVRERAWRTVSARIDAPPEVRLLLPESDLEVKPTDEIAFFFEASDDYGLDGVTLVVTSDEGDELERTIVREPRGERLSRGDYTVSVTRLGLDAGDSADIYFEATDLNSLHGPGIARSQSRRLSIYSPEAEHERLLARLDKLIGELVVLLADRLESPVEDQARFRLREYVTIGTKISAEQAQVLDHLTELLGSLSTDGIAKPELREGVQEVRDRLQDVQDQEAAHLRRAVVGSATADDDVMVSLLYRANEEGISEAEAGAIKLHHLLDESRKDSVLDAGRELLETQNEIMELLKKLKESKDPEALAQALKKLDKLQDKLRKLQQELGKLRERVPYENQNAAQRPSDKQRSMRDMKSTMDKIQELLAEGKVDEAMKLLEELNRDTQQLMASLEDDLDGGKAMPQAAQQKAQELSTKLDELADGQRGLKSETSEAEREIERRLAGELQESAREALDAAKTKAEALKKTLDGIDEAPLSGADKEALDELKGDAKELAERVDQGRVSEAAEHAKELAEKLEGLNREVGESAARELDEERLEGLERGRDQLGHGREQAEALAEELQGLQPKPGEGLNPKEDAELKRLGERQGQLGKRLEQLKDSLKELESEIPGIESELKEPLQQAGEAMGEANKELSERRPHEAGGKQQEALERLEKAQEQMQQRMQEQRGQGGQEQQGLNDPNTKVEIPEEDPYAKPRDLRQELLKAMKERAPEQYRDAIEEFYKGLMK